MKKRFFLSILSLMLVFQLTSPAIGAGTRVGEVIPQITQDTQTIILREDPNSDVPLEIVKATHLTDGRMIFSITGGHLRNLITFAYDIDFDIEQGIYKTTMVPLADTVTNPSLVEDNYEFSRSSTEGE